MLESESTLIFEVFGDDDDSSDIFLFEVVVLKLVLETLNP